MRSRTLLVAAALAALVVPFGQPVAQAAAPTPAQVKTPVADAMTARRGGRCVRRAAPLSSS